jgi:hypothetical protein
VESSVENNVFDIMTGEPVEGYKPQPRQEACMIAEMMFQRRSQIQDMIVIWIENDPLQSIKWGCTPMSEIEMMGLIEFLRDCAKPPHEPDADE